MATYNGAKYIKPQLESILIQLDRNDELIISDDNSTDNTIDIINSYNDNRIKIFSNPKKGIITNFENAIKRSVGDYIFLADQDDIWCEDKVKQSLKYLLNVDLIISDAYIIDENGHNTGRSYFDINKSKPGFINNIINGSYLGCAMAFRKEIKSYILPFPINIPMHDLWIGSLVTYKGKAIFINEKLILYRRHGNNASSSGQKSTTPLLRKLSYRTELVALLLKRILFKI